MIRLSHSTLDILHTCERLFQLERLLAGARDKQDYPATLLGKAFGVGVCTYLLAQDKDKAIWDAWLAFVSIKETSLPDSEVVYIEHTIIEDDIRTEESLVTLLLSSFPALDKLLLDWEVAYFNSRPSVELSIRMDIDGEFYYVGYVDIVLKNRFDNTKYAVMDNKTTALNLRDLSPKFGNSGQLIGYSIVLDQIVGSEQTDFQIIYFVGQLNAKNIYQPTIHTLTFNKTIQDRLNWFITLGMDVNHIKEMMQLNIFPKRGESCLQYMKPCKHFGTCHIHALDRIKEEEVDTIEYQFVYSLDDIIINHLKRIGDSDV